MVIIVTVVVTILAYTDKNPQKTLTIVDRVHLLNEQGLEKQKVGLFKEAIDFHFQAVEIMVSYDRAVESLDKAKTYHNLATAYHKSNNYNDAKLNYRKALKYLREDRGFENEHGASIITNLGIIASKENDPEAKATLEHAKKIYLKLTGFEKEIQIIDSYLK